MQADCCTEPGAIFPFLEGNGVGLEHSLFYEAYATLLEYCRDFAKANDVYGIGISR
jgi:checkpoint serine/threonine-protein kinase